MLEEEETHHASASRRVRVGDRIALIDGEGVQAVAIVEAVSHQTLTFTVEGRRRVPPPSPAVWIASAVPKGERFRTMIDMLSQTGVTGVVPLVCERSAVMPKASARERWRRVAIEACKQSRNPYVPDIRETQSLEASLAWAGPQDVIGFADLDGNMLDAVVPRAGVFRLYIGPEGGFTDTEIALLRDAGGLAVNLGTNVLRIETAAVVGAALSRLVRTHRSPRTDSNSLKNRSPQL